MVRNRRGRGTIMRSVQQVVRAAAGLVVVAGAVALWTSDHPASKRPGPNRQPRAAERAAPALAAFDGNHAQVLSAYANLPVAFIENRGQTDSRVRYYAQGSRYGFYLTRDQVVLSFVKRSDALGARTSGIPAAAVTATAVEEPATEGVALALRFLGSNPQAVVEGEERA